MKLFVWSNLSFLADYGQGVVFAMAETKELAIEKLMLGTDWEPANILELYKSKCEELTGLDAFGYLQGSA